MVVGVVHCVCSLRGVCVYARYCFTFCLTSRYDHTSRDGKNLPLPDLLFPLITPSDTGPGLGGALGAWREINHLKTQPLSYQILCMSLDEWRPTMKAWHLSNRLYVVIQVP